MSQRKLPGVPDYHCAGDRCGWACGDRMLEITYFIDLGVNWFLKSLLLPFASHILTVTKVHLLSHNFHLSFPDQMYLMDFHHKKQKRKGTSSHGMALDPQPLPAKARKWWHHTREG